MHATLKKNILIFRLTFSVFLNNNQFILIWFIALWKGIKKHENSATTKTELWGIWKKPKTEQNRKHWNAE